MPKRGARDDWFWSQAPRLEGDFPQHWKHSWVYDFETLEFLEVNGAAIERYGYSREEFLKMRLTDIRAERDRAALVQAILHREHGMSHAGVW